MEMHDTLYLSDDALLRTHTSPVQVRTLQRYAPPVRVLAPGQRLSPRLLRRHARAGFAQIEGLAVDEGITFVDLKATLAEFARRFYGGTRRVRFGPSYFPFTEPSAQMDVRWICGDGTRTALGGDPRLWAWCIRTCSRRRASTASATPAGRSAWGPPASP